MTTNSQLRTIVIDGPKGQLGNKLFTFAHIIAFAAANNTRVAFPGFFEYAKLFKTTSRDCLCRFPEKRSLRTGTKIRMAATTLISSIADIVQRSGVKNGPVKVLNIGWERFLSMSDPEFKEAVQGRGWLICRGFQYRDEANLRAQASDVRSHFAMISEHQDRVDELIREASSSCDMLVGVHVRRTDSILLEDGRYFYPVEQYCKLMQAVREMHVGRKIGFLVCSDEKLDRAAFGSIPVTFGTGNIAEDLYSLAGCDRILAPPSTYSMWASYYGNTPLYRVFDPEQPFTPDSFHVFGF